MAEKAVNPVAKMLEPFAPNEINQIPKGNMKLDYVGHAALTKRLLETDLEWSWEPFAIGEDGLPKLDEKGGLWIRLTVCGITRIGYGDSGNSRGTQAVKEAIGDALRNAGMRFGAALDLWHKGDLFDLTDSRGDAKEEHKPTPTVSPEILALVKEAIEQVAGIESVAELKMFYTGAQEVGLLTIPVGNKTLQKVIADKKKELESVK